MINLEHRPWHEAYQSALREAGEQQRSSRVEVAQWAIFCRLQEIQVSTESRLEAQAIDDALRRLCTLRKEAASFTNSPSIAVSYETNGAQSEHATTTLSHGVA